MTNAAPLFLSLSSSVQVSEPLKRFAIGLAALIFLTSSFDIFLIVEAGGNYRFCQLITPCLILLAIVKAVRGTRLSVLGGLPLLIWLVCQISFIPATAFWPKSLGYCLWLSLNLGLVFACVQLFGDDVKSLITILRWYLYSFALVASFGIAQFLLPLLGLAAPLVKQWLIPGALARVNGFSYEPSYFATYLLIGFVFTGSLRRNRSSVLPARSLLAIYLLSAVSIILSSSRMGIFFLFVDVCACQLRPWASFLGDLVRLRIAVFKLRALIPSVLSLACIYLLVAGTSSAINNNPALAVMFLNGTGISDTAAHSVVQREDAFQDTLTVFLQHPLIGRSLGGVSVAIADLHGDKIHSFEDSKDYEGMNVFAEALAASGVIGIIPFACFLITTFKKPLRLARGARPFYGVLLYALLRSLFFAWAILQFNQNMLRPYLWTHIAILASVYAAALQSVSTSARLRSSPHEF